MDTLALWVAGLLFLSGPLPALLRMGGLKWRWFFCHVLAWHSPGYLWEFIEHDGASAHVRCPWCGLLGMVDSQGNLF